MAARKVKDEEGRTWACRQDDASHDLRPGQDVSVLCTTETVSVPLRITVGWQWLQMADNGLARIISAAAPVPAK